MASSDTATQLREVLLHLLGAKCAKCGGTLMSVLEVDHVDGRDWRPRDYSRLQRVLKYFHELASGVRLRCLCRRCNAIDGAIKGNAWFSEPLREARREQLDDLPF